jgi:hypothetical protein
MDAPFFQHRSDLVLEEAAFPFLVLAKDRKTQEDPHGRAHDIGPFRVALSIP